MDIMVSNTIPTPGIKVNSDIRDVITQTLKRVINPPDNAPIALSN